MSQTGSANVRHPPPAPLNAALSRLFQRMLDEMDGNESVEWDGQEGYVAAAAYSDPDFLAREVKHVCHYHFRPQCGQVA